VSQIVAIYCPTLKDLLMSLLALVLFWESHISIHMTAMSDLREALIMQGWNTRVMLLNSCVTLMISSI